MISLKNPTKQTKLLLFGLASFVLVTMVIIFVVKSDENSGKAKFNKRWKEDLQLSTQTDKATNPAWLRMACKQVDKDNAELANYALKHGLSFMPPIAFGCWSSAKIGQ